MKKKNKYCIDVEHAQRKKELESSQVHFLINVKKAMMCAMTQTGELECFGGRKHKEE